MASAEAPSADEAKELFAILTAAQPAGSGLTAAGLSHVMRQHLGSKQATDEEAQDILAEVAPSGELALDTFESLAQGKKEFPDSQRALQQAFETIGGPESAKSGQVDADKLRAVLTTFGCKLSEEEVDDLLARASSAGGKFDVADFLSQCFA